MGTYIIRRLGLAVILVVGATFITFLLSRIVPSDPLMMYVGRFASQEQIERARIELGLDKPWYVQYARYLQGLVKGDWGISIRTHRPVVKELLERVPASLELVLAGMALGLSTGILLGIFSAAFPHSMLDNVSRIVAVSGVALPQFWFAMILQLVFGRLLGILPLVGRLDLNLSNPVSHLTGFFVLDSLITGNWEAFRSALLHLVLPAVAVATYPMAMSTRLIRAKLLEVLGQDYIRTARAFGLPEIRVFTRHALRNAAGPVVTMTALSFVFTLIGTFMVETIFGWPGLGSYAAESILSNDTSVVMSVTVLIAIATILLNLLADLVVAWMDPRIRYG